MTVKIYAATLVAVALVAPPLSTSLSRSGRAQTIDVLRGAIDIHVHSDPDNVPRSIDAIEVAKLARARGMRGIVLKNHYDPTAGLAFLARKEAPGLEVFGGDRPQSHRRRHEPGCRRAHDAGRGRMGTCRLDVDLRCRKPGALLEGEPAVRQRGAER